MRALVLLRAHAVALARILRVLLLMTFISAVLGSARTLAPRVPSIRLHVILELHAVCVLMVARNIPSRTIRSCATTGSPIVIITLRAATTAAVVAVGLLLVLLLLQGLTLDLLLLSEVDARVLVQVVLEVRALAEGLVCFGDGVALVVDLDLVDLLKVLLQLPAARRRVLPLRRLGDDRGDRCVVYHRADIDLVVHLPEYAALVGVLDIDELEQLQPQILQLVRVVLEQVEVVAHSRQDLVEVFLQFAAVLVHLDLFGRLVSVGGVLLLLVLVLATLTCLVCILLHLLPASTTITSITAISSSLSLHVNLVHKIVLLGVLL